MKRVICIMMFLTTMVVSVLAQRDGNGSTISFISETGCETNISIPVLAEIIAYSDTISGEKSEIIKSIYEKTFTYGDNLVILIANDDYFDVIFMQEDKNGEIMGIQVLTKEGWLDTKNEPYCRELIDLASTICMIQHILDVSGP